MTLPTGSTDFPQGLGTVNIEGRLFTPVSIDIPTEAIRIIQRTDEVGNASDYQIRTASEKITGTITVDRKNISYSLTEEPKARHESYQPKSGQKLFYDGSLTNDEGTLFCTITDVKTVRSDDTADQIELGVVLDHFSPSSLDLYVSKNSGNQNIDIALQPTKAYYFSDLLYEVFFNDNDHKISSELHTQLYSDRIVGGRAYVLQVTNNGYHPHQLYLNDEEYKKSKSGRFKFNYYVSSGSLLIGKYFHIGIHDDNGEQTFTKIGHQIVADTWTTVELFYGKEFGGKDKPTYDDFVLHTYLNNNFYQTTNGISHNGTTSDVSVTHSNNYISDGTTTISSTLKITNNVTKVPQLKILNNSDYTNSTSGEVTFTYYVPEDHPIVGGYWHIGTSATASPSEEISYSPYGMKIQGGEWTTTTLQYGSHFGGVDKDNGFRFLTVLTQKYADGDVNKVEAEAGDFWYLADVKLSAITTPNNPSFSGSFSILNTTNNTYDGTYTYDSNTQRWSRDSTHYFEFNSGLNKWEFIYGSNTLTSTYSMLTPWHSGWTDDLDNFDFFKGNVVETGGIQANLHRAFLTVTNSATSGEATALLKSPLGFYLHELKLHKGYKQINFVDCGSWWIDDNTHINKVSFGESEFHWQLDLNDSGDRKIGLIPSDVGVVTISLALRLGNFYKAEVDLTNSSSHIISFTTNEDGEFVDGGMNATKIQKFDIVIDTDEPNDIDLVFNTISIF